MKLKDVREAGIYAEALDSIEGCRKECGDAEPGEGKWLQIQFYEGDSDGGTCGRNEILLPLEAAPVVLAAAKEFCCKKLFDLGVR